MDDIDELVRRVGTREAGAREQLFAAAYPELKRLARARLHRDGGRDALLDTTALVNESYLRIAHASALRGEDRGAFFAYASRVMRSVIVDSVRERQAQCRGGGAEHEPLDTTLADTLGVAAERVLDIDGALQALERADARLARIVEMRYFAGCGEREVGEALGISERHVRRLWDQARQLLRVLLQDD